MGSSLRDNGWFSKLPYLAMKLGHWSKFQKWHIYSLSNPRTRNWAHSRSTGSRFRDTGRFSYLHIYSLSTPRGWNWAHFLLYGQEFARYGPSFKIAIFGHETWQVAKVPEVAHVGSFYPRGEGVEIEVIFNSTGSGFQDTGQFSKYHIFGHETWHVAKVP